MTTLAAISNIDPHSDPTRVVRLELTTPERADAWLAAAGKPKNRHLNWNKVREFAADMENSRWRVNAETLKIDSAGHLRDGQHRCKASILAATPFWSWVAYGLEDRDIETVDKGSKRTLGDTLRMRTEKDANTLAACLRWLWKLTQSPRIIKGPEQGSDDQKLASLAGHPTIRESLAFLREVQWHKRITRGPARYAALHCLFKEQAGDSADEFFKAVSTGLGILSADDPQFRLRERLIAYGTTRYRGSRGDWVPVALTIKAWNAWKKDRGIRNLRMGRSEKFPHPVGVDLGW